MLTKICTPGHEKKRKEYESNTSYNRRPIFNYSINIRQGKPTYAPT
jgi:hypothetical protein